MGDTEAGAAILFEAGLGADDGHDAPLHNFFCFFTTDNLTKKRVKINERVMESTYDAGRRK